MRTVLTILMLSLMPVACGTDPVSIDNALRLRLQAPSAVSVNQAVPVQVVVSNVSAQPITITTACGSHFYELRDHQGISVRRSWEGPLFDCAGTLKVAARDSVVWTVDGFRFQYANGNPLPAGTYTITGSIRDLDLKPLVVAEPVTVVVSD